MFAFFFPAFSSGVLLFGFLSCASRHATRRSKDGTWTKKNSKSYFGYKLHSKSDIDYGLIRDIETTTASVHDSQIDLTKKGEVAYRDKGYFGAPSKGYRRRDIVLQ